MGKVIAAIVVIALLILGYVYFFDTDTDVDGDFDAPEVEIEGDFDAPDVDMDVDAPEFGEEEVTVEVPTIEPADEGDAEAEALDDDPDQR